MTHLFRRWRRRREWSNKWDRTPSVEAPPDSPPEREADYPAHLVQTVVTPRWFEELLENQHS